MIALFAETSDNTTVLITQIIVGGLLAAFLAWVKRDQNRNSEKTDKAVAHAENSATEASAAREDVALAAGRQGKQLASIANTLESHGDIIQEIQKQTNGMMKIITQRATDDGHAQGMIDQKAADDKDKSSPKKV